MYTANVNGVVTSVRNLMEELEKKGHQVRVLTVSERLKSHKEDNVYYIKSVSLEKVYPNVRMPISYRHRFIRELIEWKPDVIHSQCEFFSYQFASYISKKTGAPIVHTYHALYEQYVTYVLPSQRLGEYFIGKLSRMRLKHAEVIVAPTQKVENVLRNYGIQNPIQVIPSGIALEQHKGQMPAEERLSRRKALGIPEDHTVLLNLGRLAVIFSTTVKTGFTFFVLCYLIFFACNCELTAAETHRGASDPYALRHCQTERYYHRIRPFSGQPRADSGR